MKRITRMTGGLLAALLLAGLAGCGGDKNPASKSVTTTTGVAAATTPEETGEPGGLPTGETIGEGTQATLNGTATATKGGGQVLKPNTKDTTAKQGTPTKTKSGAANQPTKAPVTGLSEQEKMFASLKGTTVTIPIEGTKPNEDLVKFYAKLKEKYGMTVKNITMGWTESQTKLGQMVAAGNPPDKGPISEVLGLRYIYSNIAQPIDKYVLRDDPYMKQMFLDVFTVNNKLYAIPSVSLPEYLVYYNKTLFKEYNQKEPYTYYQEGNWTFKTFLDVCKAMTKYEADGKTIKFQGMATWNYGVFMMANGGTGIAPDGKGGWKVTIDQPAEMAGLQIVHDLAAANAIYTGDGYVGFRQRKNAILIERPSHAVGQFDYYNRMDDDIGLAPLPMGPNVKQYHVPLTNDGSFVPRGAKNPLGAVCYMYEDNKKMIDEDNDPNLSDPVVLKNRRKNMSDEHLKILQNYMKTAVPMYTHMEGLAGWWTGDRAKFWDPLVKQAKQPSEVVDAQKSLIQAALKRTVG